MTTPTHHAMASAALRHVRDAQQLCEPPCSFDQAWHLAGFGPECARKAAINDPALHRIVGHGAGDPEVLDWALALDVHARRIVHSPAPTREWRPEHRYSATGQHPAGAVRPFVAACTLDTIALVAELWCTGLWSGQAEVDR